MVAIWLWCKEFPVFRAVWNFLGDDDTPNYERFQKGKLSDEEAADYLNGATLELCLVGVLALAIFELMNIVCDKFLIFGIVRGVVVAIPGSSGVVHMGFAVGTQLAYLPVRTAKSPSELSAGLRKSFHRLKFVWVWPLALLISGFGILGSNLWTGPIK